MWKFAPIIVVILLIIFVSGFFAGKDSGPADVILTFDECVAAGNPVMESYPRQCTTKDGIHFIEEIVIDGSQGGGEAEASVMCRESQRDLNCTQEYDPVCALVRVECITLPCDPVVETFSNGCSACSNKNVISYTAGECEAQ